MKVNTGFQLTLEVPDGGRYGSPAAIRETFQEFFSNLHQFIEAQPLVEGIIMNVKEEQTHDVYGHCEACGSRTVNFDCGPCLLKKNDLLRMALSLSMDAMTELLRVSRGETDIINWNKWMEKYKRFSSIMERIKEDDQASQDRELSEPQADGS